MSLARCSGRARVAIATVQAPVRCAIYTRKSTDDGLDRAFTSLDNQRERAESYIESQTDQGWRAIPDRYDDGGFSGGTTDRPALQRLIADIETGLVDVIVVYKLDRLSRSVCDFVNLHRFLEKHRVEIVSVTEPIDTRTPMGRAFVTVLMSFGQMEREQTAERTRDKMHAARRRGKWTGGTPILGLDTAPEGGRLVVNKDEAEQVRAIFELFTGNPSLIGVATELNRRGWRRKSWTTKDGTRRNGGEWNRLNLRTLLTNPLYAGLQKLGDETFQGEHPAIISKALFQRVQRLLDANQRNHRIPERNRHGALLRGLLTCAACGSVMLHAPTKKNGRVFRYYRCGTVLRKGAGACSTKPLNAEHVEHFVVDEVRRIGADPALQAETFRLALAQVAAERRGLKAEAKRLDRDLDVTRRDVERLVETLSRTTGSGADAVRVELERTQERVSTLDARLAEVHAREAALATQHVDEADVARALQDFDELWSVLLTPEKERVLGLLIERVTYDGATQRLEITFSPAGVATLAAEVGP